LNPEQKAALQRIARQRSLPSRLVERARIVLRAADGLENKQIAAQMGIMPEKVARWRNRFLEGGIAALEKDAPRPGRTRTITDGRVKQVVEMTLHQKPANATHWSTRTMATAAGISEASVRRIWRAHGLKPHLTRTFKLSRDPEFTEKLEDVVGLYLNRPSTPSCCAPTRRARFRLWTAPSQGCR
jgi:transposase